MIRRFKEAVGYREAGFGPRQRHSCSDRSRPSLPPCTCWSHIPCHPSCLHTTSRPLPRPLRVVLDGGKFKALVNGEVAECVAVTGENVDIMLDDMGFAMMEATIKQAQLRG